MIGRWNQLQLVQHTYSVTASQRAKTSNELECAVITLLRLDDDDGKAGLIFFMQDGAAGEIKVNRAAPLSLGKIKVEDSPASLRIIFCCGPSLNAWCLTSIRHCDRSPDVLSFSFDFFHDLF